mmetsp:Transcript_18497/g.51906  ORF Transcript_18497/g.51906 Transcript_18497/m.51906 type:complete len:564 (-) Transcript_18497:806-2497(-)
MKLQSAANPLQGQRLGGLNRAAPLAKPCRPSSNISRVACLQPNNKSSNGIAGVSPLPQLSAFPKPVNTTSSSPVATQAQQGGGDAAAPKEPPFKWGADMKNLGICVGLSLALWFIPPPAGVSIKAWHLLSVFTGTIVGIITTPLPLGAVAVLGLGAAMLTKVLTFAEAFSAFSSEIPWLIAIAYWLAGGFIKSGLGNRIAYAIVAAFGKTSLGLTYSLVFAEALLSPAIPSVAARAGGIFFPLAKALCLACGSDPENGTQKKLGSYLMKTCFQTTCVSSAMFITAMAANPLAVNLAAAANINITWGTWALAGLVPGLVCLVGVPLLLYALYPPELKDTPDAPETAKKQLEKCGPLSRNEKITAGAFAITVALWIGGGAIGVNAVAAATVGLAILLITNVVTWKECLGNSAAWDTLTWFAALIAMAAYLNKFGFIPWFSNSVVKVVSSMGLEWQAAFGIVVGLYFYSHYFFASGAAHIGAMYTAFLAVATACGTPPMLAAIALGQLSNLMGCLTTYGIGSAPPYFGAGYVPQADWLRLGFILSIFYVVVWLGVGGAWWKVIGLW